MCGILQNSPAKAKSPHLKHAEIEKHWLNVYFNQVVSTGSPFQMRAILYWFEQKDALVSWPWHDQCFSVSVELPEGGMGKAESIAPAGRVYHLYVCMHSITLLGRTENCTGLGVIGWARINIWYNSHLNWITSQHNPGQCTKFIGLLQDILLPNKQN